MSLASNRLQTDSGTLTVQRPLQRVADVVICFTREGRTAFVVVVEALLRVDAKKRDTSLFLEVVASHAFGGLAGVFVVTPAELLSDHA